MQPKLRYLVLLISLTLIVFILRLIVANQVPEPTYQSYFTLIQGESIRESGTPRYNDPFSYQGRLFSFTPGYYYVFALATTALPVEFAQKVLPNLFMVLLIPLFYAIAMILTKRRLVAITTAFLGAFAPILFTSYLNTTLPGSLALPLLAGLLLALLSLEHHATAVIVLTIFLSFVSPWIWLLLPTYLLYLAILTAEKLKIEPIYFEAALFTFLFAAWFTLVNYKEALFRYGFGVIANSLPEIVRPTIFSDFTILAMIYAIGVVPLFLGCIAIYTQTFEVRNRRIFLIASFALVTLLAGVLELLPLRDSLLLLSLAFIMLAAPGLQYLFNYLSKTRWPKLSPYAGIFIVFFFILSSALPAITAFYPQSAPTQEEITALNWIAENTNEQAVILARPEMGYLINYYADRKYVADTSYLLIANADGILEDIDLLYTSLSTVGVVELTEKYGITHIIIGPKEHEQYDSFGAISNDKECFPQFYKNTRVLIHGVQCELTR